MKNKMLVSTFLTSSLFFLILALAPPTHAQNTDSGLRFSCLEAVSCVQLNSQCTLKSVHRAKLTPNANAKAVPNDINTYLTECLDVDFDNNGIPESMCTTANSTLDKELFCNDANATDPQCDHYSILKQKIGYTIDKTQDYGIFFVSNHQATRQNTATRIASDGVGNVVPPIIEWQSYSNMNTVHRYLIWNKIKYTSKDPGGIGGQQQSDLEFATRSSTCGGISWDPYGRMFDTKSLEPIPGGQVTLRQLDSTINSYSEAYANRQNPNIVNPFPIGKNGLFSFIVVDGSYTLTPAAQGYTHSSMTDAALEAASPNVSKIYSDFYNTTAEPIIQKGTIQHRDIPMEPASGVGIKYPLSILTQTEELQNNGNIKYAGAVSHPFAKLNVQICSFENGKEMCDKGTAYTQSNGGPDKNGKFSIELNQKQLQTGQYYKKSFEAIDLTAPTLSRYSFMKKTLSYIKGLFNITVEAQEGQRSVSTVTQPIISYIEGFAYDAQGTLLPNSEVGIYVTFSERPVYTTKTDTHGYFKITSEYLPRTAYTIRYTSTTSPFIQTLLTTSQFLIQNQEFIESEKINPYLVTTTQSDPRRTVTPTYVPSQKTTPVPNLTEIAVRPSNIPANTTTTPAVAQPSTTSNVLLYVGILLIVISIGGGALIYYMMKKKV